MPASGAGLRRPGFIFCLAVLLAAHFAYSAPVYDQDTTQAAEFIGGSSTCYYNYKHYQEGDRIITNEPCLNCTCHNRMLMCYLRVCPFTKAIGQNCTVEKRPDQCCPVITCPEVPVQLLTSTTSSPSSGSTELGFRDNYGCSVQDLFYADGAQLAIDYHNPCELCYCIRNRTTCVMQECTLNVAGCKPIYQPGVCCPVKYDCDYDEYAATTIGPTPGLIMTTTMAPGIAPQCFKEGRIYEDGELIYSTKPCQHCYCFHGDIACAVQDCGTPMKMHGKNCTALPPPSGECCPTTYQCDDEFENEVTSLPEETEKDAEEETFKTTEETISSTTPSFKDYEKEEQPSTPDTSYPGADNTISDGDVTSEVTETLDEEGRTTEKQKEITDKEFMSSTPSLEDEFTTLLEESSTPREEIMTKTYDKTAFTESATVTKEPVELSTSIFTEEPYVTHKEHTVDVGSQFTDTPKDRMPTEISKIETTTGKLTPEGESKSYDYTSTTSGDLDISSTPVATQKSMTDEEFEAEHKTVQTESPSDFSSMVPSDATSEHERITTESFDMDKDVTSKDTVSTSTESEISVSSVGVKKSDEEFDITTASEAKEITGSTPSSTSIFDLTTELKDETMKTDKYPDFESTTKGSVEESTTKQSVTVPIAERMPEHKAEDKDSVPEMEMTEQPEMEVTSEISGTYLPPVTSSEADLGSTDPTRYRTDVTTDQSYSDITMQEQTEKSTDLDMASSPVITSSTESTSEEDKTYTLSTFTESRSSDETEKPSTELPYTEATEMSTTVTFKPEITKETSKMLEASVTTVYAKPTDKTTYISEMSTVPTETDVSDVTTESPKSFSTPSTYSTSSDFDIKSTTEEIESMTKLYSTETTSVDQRKTTEPKIPVTSTTPVEDAKVYKPTTTIISDTKQTEMPTTESLMTLIYGKESSFPYETTTGGAIEKMSTQTQSDVFTDKSTESTMTESSGPDMSTLQPEKFSPPVSTVKIEEFTDQSLSTTIPSKQTEETLEDITSKISLDEETKVTQSAYTTEFHEFSTTVSSQEEISTESTFKETTEDAKRISGSVTTEAIDLEQRLGSTEKEFISKADDTPTTSFTPSIVTKLPPVVSETLSPIAPKKEESMTEIPHISEAVTPEVTLSTVEESSRITETIPSERTPLIPEIRPQAGIPGEGNCLVDGQSFSNNSAIPPANPCQLRCRCISSIVQCDFVQCAAPPDNYENCTPVRSSSDCCPTYNCGTTVDIESDSHTLEQQTPATDKEVEFHKTDLPESTEGKMLETTTETLDHSSLMTISPVSSTEEESGKDISVTEPDRFSTIKEEDTSKYVTTSEEDVTQTSVLSVSTEEPVTSSQVTDTENIEKETELSTPSEEEPLAKTTASVDQTTVEIITEEIISEDDKQQTSEKPFDEERTTQSFTTLPKEGTSDIIELTKEPVTEQIYTTEKGETEKVAVDTSTPLPFEKSTEYVTEDLMHPEVQFTTSQPDKKEEMPRTTEKVIPEEELSRTGQTTESELPEKLTTIKDEIESSTVHLDETPSILPKESTTSIPSESYDETTSSKEDLATTKEKLPDSSVEQYTESIQKAETTTYKPLVSTETPERTTTVIIEKQTVGSTFEVESQTTQKATEEESYVTKQIPTESAVPSDKFTTSFDTETEVSKEITTEIYPEKQTTEFDMQTKKPELLKPTVRPTDFSESTEEFTEKSTEASTKSAELSTESPKVEEFTMSTLTVEDTSKPEEEITSVRVATEKIDEDQSSAVTSEIPEISIKSDTSKSTEVEKSSTSEIPLTDYTTVYSPTMPTTSEKAEQPIEITTKTSEETADEVEEAEKEKETEITATPATVSVSSEDAGLPMAVTKAAEPEETSTDLKESSTTPSSVSLETEQGVTSQEQEEDHTTETMKQVTESISASSELPSEEVSSEMPVVTVLPEKLPSEPEEKPLSTEGPETPKVTITTTEITKITDMVETEVTEKSVTDGIFESTSKLPVSESTSEASEETTSEEEMMPPFEEHLPEVPSSPEEHEEGEGGISLEPEEQDYNQTTKDDHTSTSAPEYPDQAMPEENPNFPINGGTYLNPDEDYDEDDQAIYGPGTCRYGGKVYMSAQQIPRDDPCDFCFCFRGDIICLQQSCPPPIPGCHEEPINGFCCPRYECPVSMATSFNLTTTTTTTTTTLPPHFLSHAYKGAAKRNGCQIGGQAYRVGEIIKSASGPCLQCTCEGDGNMNCDPRVCSPEPMYRQMVGVVTAKRRR